MAADMLNEAAALRELAGLALQANSIRDLAERCARWATQAVPGVRTASILLAWHDSPLLVAAADPLAHRLLARDDDLDGPADPAAGPARQALIRDRVVAATNLEGEHRWGHWPDRALAGGIGAVYAYPLRAGRNPIGVLTVYAPTDAPLTPPARARAGLLACMLAVALTAAQRDYHHAGVIEHLRTALTNRPIIDQAVGIILARHGGHPDTALTALRRTSQRHNIPVRELAEKLLAEATCSDSRRRRPTTPPPRPGQEATRRPQPDQ